MPREGIACSIPFYFLPRLALCFNDESYLHYEAYVTTLCFQGQIFLDCFSLPWSVSIKYVNTNTLNFLLKHGTLGFMLNFSFDLTHSGLVSSGPSMDSF